MKKKQTRLTDTPQEKKIRKQKYQSGSIFHETEAQTPDGILEEFIERFDRTKFYSAASGGKDSMVTTDWLDEQGKLESVIHIDTGVGLRATTDFMKDYCQSRGWKLEILRPNPRYIYVAAALEFGFPLAQHHSMIMARLKFTTMYNFAKSRDWKNHCIVGGIRKFESVRRMGNFPHPIQIHGGMHLLLPFFYYDNKSMQRELITRGLKTSPSYDLGFDVSGDCMCGAYGSISTKQLIRKHDPDLAKFIRWIEYGVKEFGTDFAKKSAVWGGSTGMDALDRQKVLDLFVSQNPELKDVAAAEGIFCGEECGDGTMRGAVDY